MSARFLLGAILDPLVDLGLPETTARLLISLLSGERPMIQISQTKSFS